MFILRQSADRGHVTLEWLESHHSFSFGQYYDPKHMGFSDLRVINQDVIAPDAGFAKHAHKDMDIISYVVRGALEHKDSMGNTSIIRPGEIQRMSAGRGVEHSEYNHSGEEEVELLQIWLLPAHTGLPPQYEQSLLPDKPGLHLIASGRPNLGLVNIDQDAHIYQGHMQDHDTHSLTLAKNRSAWIQMVSGQIIVNDCSLHPGDGLAVMGEEMLHFSASTHSTFLVFDLRG